ncbi:hypothetical protein GP486_008173 [Trichoglossum hirsutum]|uniref:Uncharacterized protein n=1 Tax=Trichoglossum hirsutum TaxID=265104 RepID=A0A9P8L4B8_9PEZI|nr:hypothetical protein GP486_008173 [Trichoglossum hirsutum]
MLPPLSTTPPDRSIKQLPSPPPSSEKRSAAVARVISLFRRHREGKLTGEEEWVQVPIQPSEYSELLQQLDQDEDLCGYIEDELRYDYNPGEYWIAIRMTTVTHDLFTRQFAQNISGQLRTIADQVPDSLAQIVRSIRDQGHGRMFLWRGNPNRDRRDVGQHCPDGAFRHLTANYPRVVFEVSLSQTRKDLEYLADAYIVDSCGEVKVVIGLDLEYRHTKESRVRVWRPKVVTTEMGERFLESELTFSEVENTVNIYQHTI